MENVLWEWEVGVCLDRESSIVNEVIGTILFFYEETLHAKKKKTKKAHKQIYAYKTLK